MAQLSASPQTFSQDAASSAATPRAGRPRIVARWLWAVAALIVSIVVVGGITRLTESGLSITEWKPLSGIIPPLSAAQWQAEFAAYRKIPEFIQINGPEGMTLADYKTIYFWEYLHRLLARAIGFAFAVPLAWFWIRKAIPTGYAPRLLALLALGGLQGAVGWWMVASGLALRTDVSHFRLSVHLMVALTTLGGIVWTALDLEALARDPRARPARLLPSAAVVLALLGVQLILGAWVAGLDAGHVASDWPTMQGSFVPAGIDWTRGTGFALTHDPFLLHFVHRWWAWVAVAALIVLARRVKLSGGKRASEAIHAAFGTQILLGIATVMSGVALPLAALHQLVGALLVIAAVWGAHVLGQRRAVPGR